jgi:transcriptional regulator with GAF, ATPase, and Fis domain
MNKLQREMHEIEAAKLKEILLRAEGNLKVAAGLLDMPKSTLSTTLQRKHPTLLAYARRLRARKGNERGRPRAVNPAHDKKTVGTAWRKAKQVLAVAARDLGIPASTLRDLLIRYDLPMKEKRRAG